MNIDWTWIDWLLAGIIVLSIIISLIRGFTREVLSLLTWVFAIWIAIKFTMPLAQFLQEDISSPEIRVIASFLGLFIATLICGSLINYIVSRLIMSTGLSGTDRLLGSLFGIARGILVCVLLIVTAGFTPLVNQPEWQKSKLLPSFHSPTTWLLSHIPTEGTISWIKNKKLLEEEKLKVPLQTPEPKLVKKNVFPDRPILEAR